jgi:hypothetical protein
MDTMSRPRRRLFLALGVVACLLLVGGGAWLLWPRSAITRENAARIEIGMTLAEVEAILGGAARDESTGSTNPVLDRDGISREELDMLGAHREICLISSHMAIQNGKPSPVWRSDLVEVFVRCDPAGRVTSCQAFPMRRADESPFATLRRWLRL